MPREQEQRDRLLALAEPVARGLGLNLVEVALRRAGPVPLLTVTVDRPGGVTVEDCRRMSRALEAELDAARVLPGRYRLDVESPGINRVLRTEREYRYFSGREVEVTTRTPQEGRRRLVGTLRGLDGDALVVEEGGRPLRLPLGDVARVRLHVRF
ncbi:MAG TPA: ribosome maturation factor RimP [Bacillota bacterium]